MGCEDILTDLRVKGTDAYVTGFNASGSVTVPGFRVNESYPQTEWTWSRYVSDVPQPGTDDTSLWQTFGLETRYVSPSVTWKYRPLTICLRPDLNLSDPNLPYTGCIIVPRSVMVSGREDDGTCSGIFNNGCINEIFSKVNASAARFSGRQKGSTAAFSCPQLIKSITTSSSSKCHDQWYGSTSTEFLPNDFSTEALSPRRCVPQNETGHPFFGWGKDPNPSTNFKDYDQAVRTPHPVIVAVWLKALPGTVDDEEDDEPGWADTRLFCIPANNTEPGSRNLTVVNRAAGGGAGRKESLDKGTLLMVLGAVAVLGMAL